MHVEQHQRVTAVARGTSKCGADLNGDNGERRIYRAYLRISDHCRVTVRVRIRVRVRNMVRVRVSIRVSVSVSVRVGVADCCMQTGKIAGKIDKLRINHVIKTDQWRSAPQIRPAPHFVVPRRTLVNQISQSDRLPVAITAVSA